MKAIVTGGAGFIGSALVDALVDRGHDVVVIDDLSRGTRQQVNSNAELVELDVRSDALGDVFRRVRPAAVFHEAAQIDVRRSSREPAFDADVNVVGLVNVLAAAAATGVERVVFASSGGTVYGDTEIIPTPEDQPYRPVSPYGAAKVCGEIYGEMFGRLHGLEFVSLRYANVYGPRQDPHGEAGVVAIFAQRLLRGQPVLINGDGLQTRDYVHVDDVVVANLSALDCPTGAYNVGTGIETDVVTLHGIIAECCGVDAPPQHGPAKAGEQRRSCLDVARAHEIIGWRPRIDIASGLRTTVDWFRA